MSGSMFRIMKFVISFAVVIILFILYIRYLECSTLFAPSKIIEATPADLGLSFEDIHFNTEDNVTLNGWFIPAAEAVDVSRMRKSTRRSTLLFLHGNAGNIGDRLGKLAFFFQMGVNVFIFDYRGYGKSQGNPTENGIYKDAVAAYEYLLTRSKDVDPKNIVAYGASLGGVVAIDLATKRELSGVIVDSAFTSARDMAKEIYPFLPSFFIQLKLDSIVKIKYVTIPKLFFHSKQDEIVPFALGEKLYRAAPSPKKFLQIRGTHVNAHTESAEEFVKGITDFLSGLGIRENE